MILSLFISILIVYGITLILVQGKIFANIKKCLSNLILKLEKYYTFETIDIIRLIENNDGSINEKEILLYNEIISKLKEEKNEENLEKLSNILNSQQQKIKNIILKNKKYKPLYKFLVWCLNTLQELINCMMCASFWIGIFLTCLTLIFNISICGSSLCLITPQGDITVILATFMLGTLYSGTTWIINAFVDFFFELKDKLGSFLDKKINSN